MVMQVSIFSFPRFNIKNIGLSVVLLMLVPKKIASACFQAFP